MKPRYAIVRVDNSCPAMVDDFGCIIARNILHCKCGEDTKNYGDTKEQLIHKIAQVMLRKFLKGYLGTAMKPKMAEEQIGIVYKNYLEIAKEIVEVLGVE